MTEIKKIKITSLANITGFIYAILGFLIGVCMFCLVIGRTLFDSGVLIDDWSVFTFQNLGYTLVVGIVNLLIMGVIGWILGLITGFLYNVFASRVGGIKVELEEK